MKIHVLLFVALAAVVGSAPPASATDPEPEGRAHAVLGDIAIHEPYVPAPPPTAKTAAAYLAIANGGGRGDTLVSAASPVAGRVMLHQSVVVDGVARMRHVEGGIDIPAGGRVSLEPGGYHIMLMKLAAPLAEGKTVELTLIFEHAGALTIATPVVAPGGAMQGHGHAADDE